MAEILLKVGVKHQLININFLQDYVYTISSNFSRMQPWNNKSESIDGNAKALFEIAIYHERWLIYPEKGRGMIFNATLNIISAISWRSVLLVEETGVPGENYRPVASHWQTLSHNSVSSTPCLSGVQTHNISGDKH